MLGDYWSISVNFRDFLVSFGGWIFDSWVLVIFGQFLGIFGEFWWILVNFGGWIFGSWVLVIEFGCCGSILGIFWSILVNFSELWSVLAVGFSIVFWLLNFGEFWLFWVNYGKFFGEFEWILVSFGSVLPSFANVCKFLKTFKTCSSHSMLKIWSSWMNKILENNLAVSGCERRLSQNHVISIELWVFVYTKEKYFATYSDSEMIDEL